MRTDNNTPVIINVRQSTGTYIAKAKGLKPNVSCSAGPAHAAEALAKKLGLAPGLLEEHSRDGLAYGCERYTHPGQLIGHCEEGISLL